MAAAPVVDDLSAFAAPGRAKTRVPEGMKFTSTVRTPAQGIQDGVDAERIGFANVYIAERLELKEAGVMLGGIAAKTSTIGVGVGIIGVGTRHPMLAASLGATMQAAFGGRFTMGLGRGVPGWHYGSGVTLDHVSDYCTLLKRIWRGERFDHQGPAGSFTGLGLQDWYEGDPPPIYYGGYGLPKAARMVAETPAIDGIIIPGPATPAGLARSVANLHTACERADRDPDTVRVIVEILSAPELDDEETRQLIHARIVTFIQPRSWGRPFELLNDWDPAVGERIRGRPELATVAMADQYHRKDLMAVTEEVPDEWVADSSAVGDLDTCVKKLQEFKDAGAAEIVTCGSTPAQNARLVEAWRRHKAVAA